MIMLNIIIIYEEHTPVTGWQSIIKTPNKYDCRYHIDAFVGLKVSLKITFDFGLKKSLYVRKQHQRLVWSKWQKVLQFKWQPLRSKQYQIPESINRKSRKMLQLHSKNCLTSLCWGRRCKPPHGQLISRDLTKVKQWDSHRLPVEHWWIYSMILCLNPSVPQCGCKNKTLPLCFLITAQRTVSLGEKVSLLSLCFLVWLFGLSDWLQCQPALPHITRAKTLCPDCATNLCSRLKQKKITTLPGRDTTPPPCSLTVFLVYPLICVC